MRARHLTILLALLCAPPAAAQQQAQEKKKPLLELFEVVVVTAQLEKPEIPTTIAEVTAEQIRERNVNNLGEALSLLPGVQFRLARAKTEQQVTVRGFEQEKVLILIDGIPVSIPYEGQISLADIPVQNIESIRLIKGIASPLYGTNAMGGAVNIITRKGEARPSFLAQYEGSRYATHHLQVGHGWKIGPVGYYAAFSHNESNGYPLARPFKLPESIIKGMAAAPATPSSLPNVPIPRDEKSRDNSDYVRDAVTLTGTLALSARNTLGVSFEHYDNRYGIPPVPIYRETKRGFYYFPRYWRFTDWNRTMINVVEESRLTDGLILRFRGFYDKYDNLLDIYDDPSYTAQNRISPPSGNTLYDDYDAGFGVYAYWRATARNELRAALNFRRDVHRETGAAPPPAGPTDRLASDTWSVGIEDEIRLSDGFTVTPGIAIDRFDKRERFQSSVSGAPGADLSSISPQLGMRYDASGNLSFYGSVGRKIRFPTMRNLYATGVIGPTGNPDLEEESTDNTEIGMEAGAADKVRFGAAFFHSRIRNMINFDNLIGRFEQYPRASIAGVELNARARVTEATDLLLAYTFMKSRAGAPVRIDNRYLPSLVYRPEELPYRPAHQVDMEARHRFRFGLEAGLNGNYFSEATYYDRADPRDNRVLTAVRGRLDGYLLLNAKLTQKLKKGFSIYLGIENLANREYQTLYLFPAPGRTYRGGIRFEMR